MSLSNGIEHGIGLDKIVCKKYKNVCIGKILFKPKKTTWKVRKLLEHHQQ